MTQTLSKPAPKIFMVVVAPENSLRRVCVSGIFSVVPATASCGSFVAGEIVSGATSKPLTDTGTSARKPRASIADNWSTGDRIVYAKRSRAASKPRP